MAQFLKQASALKVKEVPQFVQKYASENLTPAVVEGRFTRWYNTYKKTYIDTGSAKPLFDLCIYGFIFSYAVSWPREYAHYKHEQEAKLKGGAAHH